MRKMDPMDPKDPMDPMDPMDLISPTSPPYTPRSPPSSPPSSPPYNPLSPPYDPTSPPEFESESESKSKSKCLNLDDLPCDILEVIEEYAESESTKTWRPRSQRSPRVLPRLGLVSVALWHTVKGIRVARIMSEWRLFQSTVHKPVYLHHRPHPFVMDEEITRMLVDDWERSCKWEGKETCAACLHLVGFLLKARSCLSLCSRCRRRCKLKECYFCTAKYKHIK